jgi:hypothetical protein
MRGAAALVLGALSGAPAAADDGPCAERDGARACFAEPTGRYPHGVLGDAIEWGALHVTLADGRRAAITLPGNRVFEDVEPRLAELDGAGPPEIVVVESSRDGGARLSIYAFDRGALRPYARTAEIGRPNRWLAPVGIADLNGDGRPDVAYVETPHLAGVLRVWNVAAGGLTQIAAARGFSNHRIGEDFISGGIRGCDGRPEMVTADLGWTRILASRVEDGTIVARDLGPGIGPEDFEAALACRR